MRTMLCTTHPSHGWSCVQAKPCATHTLMHSHHSNLPFSEASTLTHSVPYLSSTLSTASSQKTRQILSSLTSLSSERSTLNHGSSLMTNYLLTQNQTWVPWYPTIQPFPSTTTTKLSQTLSKGPLSRYHHHSQTISKPMLS